MNLFSLPNFLLISCCLLFFNPYTSNAKSLSLNNIFNFWNSKHVYRFGEKVDLLVNSATSNIVNDPYFYYHLPFICPASSDLKPVHLSLNEILNGDRFWQSDYKLIFGKDENCLRLCDRFIDTNGIKRTINFIKNDYIVNWVIDGLPLSTTFISNDGVSDVKKYYIPGFSLGFEKDGKYFLNNHLMIVIRYHKELNNNEFSIVGIEIYPKSVDNEHCPGASKNFNNLLLKPTDEKLIIPYTYSIYWREDSNLEYNDRLKIYLNPNSIDSNGNLINNNNLLIQNNNKIHWISLINSFVILFLFSIISGFILLSTFHSKFSSNNLNPSNNLLNFNSSAKLSFSNNPSFFLILSVLSGSGIQLIFTLLGSGLFSFIFLNNNSIISQNSAFIILTIIILLIGGFFAGFSSIQFFKLFNNSNNLNLKKNLLISSLSGSFLISLGLIIIIITNLLIYHINSPRSIKYGSLILFFLIYILLQIPLSILGGLISKNFNLFTNNLNKVLTNKSSNDDDNTNSNTNVNTNNNTNNNTTKLPIYLKFPLFSLILGFAPYSIIFIESRFLYLTLFSSSITITSSNLILGFIVLAILLLFFIMIEIGIVLAYLKLTKFKNIINWQWWIFINTFLSLLIYLLPTSIYYLIFKMRFLDSASPILFIVYSTILNVIISLACGSLTLWSSTWFLYFVAILSNVKKD